MTDISGLGKLKQSITQLK